MNELEALRAREAWLKEFLASTIEFWEAKLHGVDQDDPNCSPRVAKCKGYLDAMICMRSNYFGRSIDTFIPKEGDDDVEF